MYFFIK